MNNASALMPLIIAVWLGFAACLGVFLMARFAKSGFQRRMAQTLKPVEEDVDGLLLQEQKDDEMNKSLAQRLLQPVLTKLGARMKAKAKGARGDQVRDMLEQAGHPLGMGYAEFMGLKMLMFMVLSALGFATSFIAIPPVLGIMGVPADPSSTLLFQGIWVAVFAFLGFAGPTFWLRRFVNKRIKQIRKAMADVVDLIVLGIEAGLGFDSAVGKTVEKTKGPLTDELKRVLAEVNVGKPQGEAFRDMALRVKMTDLTLLVAAIDQAMKMGVGLAQALRIQATEIREKRMAFIREQAGKLPVKMMLPLVLFIFPALFVVILGPAACQMVQMSEQGMFSGMGV